MNRVSDIFNTNLRLAIKASVNEVRDEAQIAHNFTSRSGDLERSVETEFSNDGMSGRAYLDTNIAPYAGFVHSGTPAHKIFPVRRMALRWPNVGANASFIFAKVVNHPGTKADPFLFNALETKHGEINSIFRQYVGKACEEVADVISNR